MWSSFFYHAFDFSIAFDEFKRPLTLFTPSLPMFSYSHHFDIHATTYDKLLRAWMASEWSDSILDAEWLMLLKPHVHHLSEA